MLTEKERQSARKAVASVLRDIGFNETADLVLAGSRDNSTMVKQAMQLVATIKQHVL